MELFDINYLSLILHAPVHSLPSSPQRWFLYPPDHQPVFHPDVTTLLWSTYTLPHLSPEERPMECTLKPGEVS